MIWQDDLLTHVKEKIRSYPLTEFDLIEIRKTVTAYLDDLKTREILIEYEGLELGNSSVILKLREKKANNVSTNPRIDLRFVRVAGDFSSIGDS